MKVCEAIPGQLMFARDRNVFILRRTQDADTREMAKTYGFQNAYLLAALDGVDESLLYIGPIDLPKFCAGLKRHHLFLLSGEVLALSGYDFKHLYAL
tara:strand:- start:605 stop:895 length:291 start_codon:yes stop_codon:yes gene_type:complete